MLNSFLKLELLNINLSYPFLFLIIIGIVFLLCSAFFKLHKSFYIALTALSLVLSAFLILSKASNEGLELYAFLDTLTNDIVSFYSSLIILGFSFLYILMQNKESKGEFYALFLFMVASLLLMVSSSNLVLIFIALEGSSLALYTLIAMKASKNAISSAIKYFSLAIIGSGFFVMAAALIYAKIGTLDLIWNLKDDLKGDFTFLSACVMIFILCAIKLSLVPFHFWLKDVYYASNSTLIAFISVVPKIAILAVIIRIFSFLNGSGFEKLIIFLAVFSMLSASLAALSQNNIKKMLAYSSVVHSSFVLLACVPLIKGENFNLNSIFLYWLLFAFANYGVFMVLNSYKNADFKDLNSLLYKKPVMAFCLSISVLSLAGIPPFAGFLAKFVILKELVVNDYWYLALFIAFASMIMLYAYLKILINALFIKAKITHIFELNFTQKLILTLCIFVSIFAILLML